MDSSWQSDGDIRPGYSLPDTPDFSMTPSQPGSRSDSPERHPRPKKRVEWHLTREPTLTEETEPPSHRTSDDDAKFNLVDEITGEPLGKEITNAELRREMRRIFEAPIEDESDLGEGSRNAQRSQNRNSTSSHPSNGSSETSRRHSDGQSTQPRPRSALRKGDATPPSNETPENDEDDDDDDDSMDSYGRKSRSAADAQKRAVKMAESLGDETDDVHSTVAGDLFTGTKKSNKTDGHHSKRRLKLYHEGHPLRSGYATPEDEESGPRFMTMGLSAVNMLNKVKSVRSRSRQSSIDDGTSSRNTTPNHSPPESRSHSFFMPKSARSSTTSLADLIQSSSAHLGAIGGTGVGRGLIDQAEAGRSERAKRPTYSRSSSAGLKEAFSSKSRKQREAEIHIKRHVQETVFRQRYLLKLCRALMEYGAPTHRLEEYMKMSARTLEIEAQFLYIPGCVIISFDDSRTHTTEVKLVRSAQGVDLGKLRDTHDVYKDVVHDEIGVEEATERLVEVMSRKPKFSKFWEVFMYGVASASVAPFAFYARWIDLPICFLLGGLLGFLKVVVAPFSELYSNIFEIFAVILTSFLARAFGSINGGDTFCFSAMAQSSLALILPGYTVLRAALELQAKSLVAGSVHLVYAIIFSLFIGFGLTIGTVIYGAMDSNATSTTKCTAPLGAHWYYLFVPIFSFCLAFVNKAKWREMPIMIIIAFVGWIISYQSSQRFSSNLQISNTLAALGIAVMANLYGRVGGRKFDDFCDKGNATLRRWTARAARRYGLEKLLRGSNEPTPSSLEKQVPASEDADAKATRNKPNLVRRKLRTLHRMVVGSYVSTSPDSHASGSDAAQPHRKEKKEKRKRLNYTLAASAMLPAIFVQVPSGLSVSGSLVAGIQSANQIAGNATTTSSSGVVSSGMVLDSGSASSGESGTVMFGVAYSVVQIGIGIAIGLYLGTLVCYPLGKGGMWSRGMRSGIFSF